MADALVVSPEGGGSSDDGLVKPQRRWRPLRLPVIGAPVERAIQEADGDAEVVRHERERLLVLFAFALLVLALLACEIILGLLRIEGHRAILPFAEGVGCGLGIP